jgi:hypothetical protein
MAAHREIDTEHLLKLSDEVSRIATTLAGLSSVPKPATFTTDTEMGEPGPDIPVRAVTAVIQARRLRSRYFDEELFADPAWDMMLDLLRAELSHRRVSISSLCIASAVPATTALRWLKAMTDKGFFMRRDDPLDGRRVFVELSPQCSRALRCYFANIPDAAAA